MDKDDYKSCVIYKEITLVVHVSLVQLNVIQKLDGMNIIMKLNVQNIRNNLETKNAPKNAKARKNLEISYVALWKPVLNEQKDFEGLVLFRNGVTQSNL